MTTPNSAPTSRPFASAPNADRYFPATAIEAARQRITRSITRGEGPVLVIGSAGLGKTLLLDVVARQFAGQLQTVQLAAGQLCTRRALLQMILFQLELPYRDMDESELRLSLLAHLRPIGGTPRRLLLLVDEAETLPSRLLEELRALMNLSADGQMQVSLVLAGSATIEEQFADPKLDLFSQRVSGRCYLSALGREETFQYAQAQVAASGQAPQTIFSSDSLEALFAATDGVPRLINQLGDQLMWMIDQTGYMPLDSPIVQQAWSELQQLPAPWNTQAEQTFASEVEFADLDGTVLDEEPEADQLALAPAEFDDELPASIPMNPIQIDPIQVDSFQIDEVASLDSTPAEQTLEVTELLLEELTELDEPDEEVATAQATRNPFAESFESEELVLDRYSTFESLLLAEAPRVANQSDADFSAELQQFEALEVIEIASSDKSIETPLVAACQTEACSLSRICNQEDPSSTETEIGELLVIEEREPSQNTVVSGQEFRQLFSSLEKAAGSSCIG